MASSSAPAAAAQRKQGDWGLTPGEWKFRLESLVGRKQKRLECSRSVGCCATKSKSAANPVVRTRPLCAYPKVAKYKGTGSTDDAANFQCVMPEKPKQ